MKYRTRIYYTEEQKALMWDRRQKGRLPRTNSTTNWWARQDSNLGPRDSLYPDISIRSGLSHHPQPGC